MLLLDLYKTAFGFGTVSKRNVSDYKNNHEVLNGVVLFMPSRLQISQPGQPEELWMLPNEPLISISGGNVMVRTPIDGVAGTFKEGFAMDDWRITIKGLCIQEDRTSDEYPEEQVRKLRRIKELKSSLKIVNDLAAIFGINRIAIESIEFPEFPGVPTVQPYMINCYSDQEFDLELTNGGVILL